MVVANVLQAAQKGLVLGVAGTVNRRVAGVIGQYTGGTAILEVVQPIGAMVIGEFTPALTPIGATIKHGLTFGGVIALAESVSNKCSTVLGANNK